MAEYIEREAVLALAEDYEEVIGDGADKIFFEYIPVDKVRSLPAADVRPVVRGRWKYRGQKVIDDLFPTYACSVCHGVIPADWRRKCNFCPNCGAEMEES